MTRAKAGGRDHVCGDTAPERPPVGPPVLSCIAEIGDDRRQSCGSRAPGRISEKEQLHQVLLDGRAGRLQHVDVVPPDRLAEIDLHLAVWEAAAFVSVRQHAQDLRDLGAKSCACGSSQ
jgi:hypothetical protein